MSVTTHPLTAEAMFAMASTLGRAELLEGELIRMSPAGFEHGSKSGNFFSNILLRFTLHFTRIRENSKMRCRFDRKRRTRMSNLRENCLPPFASRFDNVPTSHVPPGDPGLQSQSVRNSARPRSAAAKWLSGSERGRVCRPVRRQYVYGYEHR